MNSETINKIANKLYGNEIPLPEFVDSHLRVSATNAFTNWITECQDQFKDSLEQEWRTFIEEER